MNVERNRSEYSKIPLVYGNGLIFFCIFHEKEDKEKWSGESLHQIYNTSNYKNPLNRTLEQVIIHRRTFLSFFFKVHMCYTGMRDVQNIRSIENWCLNQDAIHVFILNGISFEWSRMYFHVIISYTNDFQCIFQLAFSWVFALWYASEIL